MPRKSILLRNSVRCPGEGHGRSPLSLLVVLSRGPGLILSRFALGGGGLGLRLDVARLWSRFVRLGLFRFGGLLRRVVVFVVACFVGVVFVRIFGAGFFILFLYILIKHVEIVVVFHAEAALKIRRGALEVAQGLSERAGQLRQTLGSDDDQGDHHDHNQLRHTDTSEQGFSPQEKTSYLVYTKSDAHGERAYG